MPNPPSAADADWDQAPLAWLLPDRSDKAYLGYRDWLETVIADWEAWESAHAETKTLTITRGAIHEALDQATLRY